VVILFAFPLTPRPSLSRGEGSVTWRKRMLTPSSPPFRKGGEGLKVRGMADSLVEVYLFVIASPESDEGRGNLT